MSRIKEQTEKVLSVSMRDNKPRMHAIQIHNNRPDGLPDGIHCGAWLDLDTCKVWKSLYGRPWINAENIVRTQEDEFLDKFSNLFYFPRNWEIKPANHLWWLVRDEAITLTEAEYKDIDNDSILQIEQTILKVNREGWAINDYITLLINKSNYNLFIGDLSCAHPDKEADDWFHIERFFRLCNRENLVTLRSRARTVLHELHCQIAYFDKNGQMLTDEQRKMLLDYKHVYASFNRPISSIWASLGDAIYKHESYPNWDVVQMIPWSWIITKEPLSEDKINSYELRWGWSSTR